MKPIASVLCFAKILRRAKGEDWVWVISAPPTSGVAYIPQARVLMTCQDLLGSSRIRVGIRACSRSAGWAVDRRLPSAQGEIRHKSLSLGLRHLFRFPLALRSASGRGWLWVCEKQTLVQTRVVDSQHAARDHRASRKIPHKSGKGVRGTGLLSH